jgi:hypothetical protein
VSDAEQDDQPVADGGDGLVLYNDFAGFDSLDQDTHGNW